MSKLVLKNKPVLLGFIISAFLLVTPAFAGNPVTPILPSDNIQDPGDVGTAWGGCGPSDSNCYVTVTSSQWTTTGSDIYYNTGNVGIGTDTFGTFTPTSLLDLKVSAVTSSVFSISNGGTKYFVVNARATNTNAVGTNAGLTATNANNSNFFGVSAGSGATNANNSNFFGNNSGLSSSAANNSNFFGVSAGSGATSANKSNFFGPSAGSGATGANNSNFFGDSAGYGTTDGYNSNFFGEQAGYNATYGNSSNFLGYRAGYGATYAGSSNFLGFSAGNGAVNSYHSNFFGTNSGTGATDASFSTFMGFHAGETFTSNNVGANNIIIGTNISLPNATANAINLGGVLFGTGAYSTTTGDPSITPVSGGRIGIGTVSPASKFDVTTNSLGTTQTNTDGILLANTTAAVNGAQQISPAIRWRGNGWKTNATAASQTVDIRAYVLPVQGTTLPTGKWILERSLNSGSYIELMNVDTAGALTTLSNIVSTGGSVSTYGGLYLTTAAAPISLNGSLGSSGQVLTSAGGSNTPTWTTLNSIATSGLSSGSGTTASGTAVNLGGNLSANTTIDTGGYSFKISNTDRGNGFLSDYTSRTTKIGDVDAIDLGDIIAVDSVNSIAYYDNTAHTGKFGIGNASPSLMLHVGSASITDATNLLRLEDENSTCDFNADAGGPSCGSDRTLKKDIISLNTVDLLARVSALNPVSYKWNTDNENDPIKYGFVAQEVAEQFPDLVTDHNWIDGTTRKFLNTSGLTPYAIGAIKELNLKVTGIENFEQENNSFGEKLRAWLANASNKITRIFTGEICLTDPDGTSECINKSELMQLKQLLNTSTPNPEPEQEPIQTPEPENPPQTDNPSES